jgi:hypothetical protein
LKARVDLGGQTAEFIPFEVISTAVLTYFFKRILVSVINTHFQPGEDMPVATVLRGSNIAIGLQLIVEISP